jgi:hypothetical protein
MFRQDGSLISVWGNPGEGEGEFNLPRDVAIGSDGSILVADALNLRIQKFLFPRDTVAP